VGGRCLIAHRGQLPASSRSNRCRELWRYLRQISPSRSHLRRQATIGPYFADFACHQTRIVIEVDGGQHAGNTSDEHRTRYLEANGYRVLRFWNNEVLGNIEGVVEVICQAIGSSEWRAGPSRLYSSRTGVSIHTLCKTNPDPD
jgi:very-short-patch-repair endonuclease